MRIISESENFASPEKLAVTIGMFDGVHRGHRQIIDQLNAIAAEKGQQSCLLTFWPHPRTVLQQNEEITLLNTQEEKMQLLQEAGLQNVFIVNFTKEFSRLSPEEFVKEYLIEKLNTGTLVIGHDHHFGRDREGSFESLQEQSVKYGFDLLQEEAVTENEVPVSSTKIRKALMLGDTAYASETLGYNYLLTGKVIHGDGIGKKQGYPTVNLDIPHYKLLPKEGVYGVELFLNGKKHFGLMNIGWRPTFNGKEKRTEVYILDFSGELYDEEISVSILLRIRDEKRFEHKSRLSEQISFDEGFFRDWIEVNSFRK